MEKITILGFSVLNRLVDRFNSKTKNFDFSIRVLGGNHFEIYPYLIQHILEEETPDKVLLDLVSTPRVPRWKPDLFDDMVRYIVSVCQSRGVKVGFLNLYRKEIDQSSDFLHSVIREVATEINAPLFDAKYTHIQSNDDLNDLYPDGNHPSERGNINLGDLIEEFSGKSFSDQRAIETPIAYKTHAPSAIFVGRDRKFDRYGFNDDLLWLPECEDVKIDLPGEFQIHGALMLMGPTTSDVRFRYEDIDVSHHYFDKFCYYERLKHTHLPKRFANSITLTQSNIASEIPVAKGEKHVGAMLGAVACIIGTHKVLANI